MVFSETVLIHHQSVRTPRACENTTHMSGRDPYVKIPPMCQNTTCISEHHPHVRTLPLCQYTTHVSGHRQFGRDIALVSEHDPYVRTPSVSQDTTHAFRGVSSWSRLNASPSEDSHHHVPLLLPHVDSQTSKAFTRTTLDKQGDAQAITKLSASDHLVRTQTVLTNLV